MARSAGTVFVELSLQDSKFAKGMKSAQQRMQAFGQAAVAAGTKIAAMGAAITAPILAASVKFAQLGDRIAKMSRRTGLAGETLSKLDFALNIVGSSAEAAEKGLKKVAASVARGDMASTEFKDALSDLGLEISDLEGMTSEEVFTTLLKRLGQVEDEFKQVGLASNVFGRSGLELLVAANNMEDFEKAMRAAKNVGAVMSAEDLQRAEALTDSIFTLKAQFYGLAIAIGQAMQPALSSAMKTAEPFLRAIQDWIRANPELIKGVFLLGVAITALGTAFIVTGTASIMLASVLGLLSTAYATVAAVIAMVNVPLLIFLGAVAAVTAAVIGLTAYIGGFSEALGEVASMWQKSFDMIMTALQSGQMGAAWEVLTTSLKLTWRSFTTFLDDTLGAVWFNMKRELAAALAWMQGKLQEWFGIDLSGLIDFSGAVDELDRARMAATGARDQATEELRTKLAELGESIAEGAKSTEKATETEEKSTDAVKDNTQAAEEVPKVTVPEIEATEANTAAVTAATEAEQASGIAGTAGGWRLTDLLRGGTIEGMQAIADASMATAGTLGGGTPGSAAKVGRDSDEVAANTRRTADILSQMLQRGGITYTS